MCITEIEQKMKENLKEIAEIIPFEEISFELIEKLQEEIAVLLLRRVQAKFGKWRKTAKYCGLEKDQYRIDKMSKRMKKIYERIK